MKPQRNTEAGEEDTEWEKIYSGAVRAGKISLCVLIFFNSDFSLWFHGNLYSYNYFNLQPSTFGVRRSVSQQRHQVLRAHLVEMLH